MYKLVLFLGAVLLSASAHAGIPTYQLNEQVRIAGSTIVVSNNQTDWLLLTSCENIVANSDTVVKAHVRRIRTGTNLRIVTDDETQKCRVTNISEHNKLIAQR